MNRFMSTYRITWIEENDLNKVSRRIRICNVDNESDELLLELKPHAQEMARGFLLDDDGDAIIPPRLYVLTETSGKTLEQWKDENLVMIQFEA